MKVKVTKKFYDREKKKYQEVKENNKEVILEVEDKRGKKLIAAGVAEAVEEAKDTKTTKRAAE